VEGIEVTPAVTPSGRNERYVTVHDVERPEPFLDLGLHLQMTTAALYLRIGISTHCDLFLDWSLVRFFLGYYSHHVGILCQVTQCVGYFPCERLLPGYLFNLAASNQRMNVGNRFLLCQVHRMKGLRQFSASSMITGKFVKMQSQAGISAVCCFWQLVPKDSSALYRIQPQTLLKSALFHEAIEK
jgi:hypothetical protein